MPGKAKAGGPGGRRRGAGRPPLGDEARSEVVRVRLTRAESVDAAALAEREAISVSDLGREAIRLVIARGSTR